MSASTWKLIFWCPYSTWYAETCWCLQAKSVSWQNCKREVVEWARTNSSAGHILFHGSHIVVIFKILFCTRLCFLNIHIFFHQHCIFLQVGKWFENTRWSFNHPSSPSGKKSSNPALRNGTPKSNKQPNQPGPETVTNTPIGKETRNVESSKTRAAVKKLSTNETNSEPSSVSSSKKRKRKEQSTSQTPDTKPETEETLTSGRVLRSRKKSGVWHSKNIYTSSWNSHH